MPTPFYNKINQATGLNNVNLPTSGGNTAAPQVNLFGGFGGAANALGNFFNPKIQQKQPQVPAPVAQNSNGGGYGLSSVTNYLNGSPQVSAQPKPVQPVAKPIVPQTNAVMNPVNSYTGNQSLSQSGKYGIDKNNDVYDTTTGQKITIDQFHANNLDASLLPKIATPGSSTIPSGGDTSNTQELLDAQNAKEKAAADSKLRTTTPTDIQNGASAKNSALIKQATDFYSGLASGTNPAFQNYQNAQQQLIANKVASQQEAQKFMDLNGGLQSFANNGVNNVNAGNTVPSRERGFQNLLATGQATLAQQQLQTQETAASALLGLQPKVVGTQTDAQGNVVQFVQDPTTGQITQQQQGQVGQPQTQFQPVTDPYTGLPTPFSSTTGSFGATSSSGSVTIPSGTLAAQNNNPGNLVFANQPGATPGAGGFAQFATSSAGFEALQNQIKLDTSRGMTLGQYITKYAPPSANNTAQYIKQATDALGVSANTPLSQVDSGKLAQFQAQKESGTQVNQVDVAPDNTAMLNKFKSLLPPTVANGAQITFSGIPYIDISKAANPQIAQTLATRLGVRALSGSDVEGVQSLDTISLALNKMTELAVNQLLPANGGFGTLGNMIKNTYGSVTGTNPKLADFALEKDSAIKAVRALAGGVGSGLRLNSDQIEIAANNLPTQNESREQALEKIDRTRDLLNIQLATAFNNPAIANGVLHYNDHSYMSGDTIANSQGKLGVVNPDGSITLQ